MKLEINLKDEPEFLNSIKDFIKEHIKGISRNEFESQIKSVYSEKLEAVFPSSIAVSKLVDELFRKEIKMAISDAIFRSSGERSNTLRQMIRDEIATQVKELIQTKNF